MAVQSLLALQNYMAGATFSTWAGGPAYQAGWPASNLRYPHQPFVVAKSLDRVGAAGVVDVVIDLGVSVAAQLIMLVNVNYTQATLTASNSVSLSPLVWDTGYFTIDLNPWNRRYTKVIVQPGVAAARYLLLRVLSGLTTTDGRDYYSTGGMFVGTLTALPSDLRWDERPQTVEPHIDTPLIGGGTSRVSTGLPYVEMAARRLALTAIETPATNDDLGGWLTIDRHMASFGSFAWYFNRGNTAEGFIFRKMNASSWNVNQVVSEDELVLHEVVGP